MRKDVDQPPERVADVEATHAPRLDCRPVFDGEAAGHRAPMHLAEIVDLDGEVGTEVPDPASLATLTCGVADVSAAKVTIHPKSMATRISRTSPYKALAAVMPSAVMFATTRLAIRPHVSLSGRYPI